MNIGLIAHNSKKVLLENFCIAYKGILKKHHLCATEVTGTRVEQASGLTVTKYLSGVMGGGKQLQSDIAQNNIDMVIYFHSVEFPGHEQEGSFQEIVNLCDLYNIPLATNIAAAESLILGLDRGDLEWRNLY